MSNNMGYSFFGDGPLILGNREYIRATYANRCIPLHKGDEVACNLTPGIDCPKLGEYWNGSQLMCVRLIRRDKWWQFWKPKYKQAVFRYMGESKVIESDIQIISSEYV